MSLVINIKFICTTIHCLHFGLIKYFVLREQIEERPKADFDGNLLILFLNIFFGGFLKSQ